MKADSECCNLHTPGLQFQLPVIPGTADKIRRAADSLARGRSCDSNLLISQVQGDQESGALISPGVNQSVFGAVQKLNVALQQYRLLCTPAQECTVCLQDGVFLFVLDGHRGTVVFIINR